MLMAALQKDHFEKGRLQEKTLSRSGRPGGKQRKGEEDSQKVT